MQCRPPPALSLRRESGALCDCPDTQAIALRIVHRTGIDRGAAIAAEGVKAFVAAFGSLDIGLGCAAQQHEMLGRCRDVDAKCRSGERLAIGAVAALKRLDGTSDPKGAVMQPLSDVTPQRRTEAPTSSDQP